MSRNYRTRTEFFSKLQDRISSTLSKPVPNPTSAELFERLVQAKSGSGASIPGYQEEEDVLFVERIKYEMCPEFLRVSYDTEFLNDESKSAFQKRLKILQTESQHVSKAEAEVG